MSWRRSGYRALGRLGDISNPTPSHFARKAGIRATGSAMRGAGCLLPVLVAAVAILYAVGAVLAFGPVRTVMANLIGALS
jgi:hypothetical protein